MRQEIVQQALGDGAAEGADANTVAVATVRALRLLLAELEPLVGREGARALYARSLHLTRPSFEWLAPGKPQPLSDLVTGLQEDLALRAPAEARRAGAAQLHTIADLLISLIGEPLTHRLLHSAWGSSTADEPSQEKSQ